MPPTPRPWASTPSSCTAYGYLIDQFFWDGTNVGEDAYGAKDLPGRARFAADILKAVRVLPLGRTIR